MPSYLIALIYFLIPTCVVLWVSRDPFSSHYTDEEYRDYRNTWLFIAVCLFLSPGIWVFYALALVALLRRRYAADIDRVTTYCFLLFAVPSIEAGIGGIGGITTLFQLDFQRMLALVVLLPLLKKSLSRGLSVHPSDKFLLLYFVYSAIMLFREDATLTAILRDIVTDFVDVVVPYFVISRNIRTIQHLNRAFLAVTFSLSLLAAEAVMEAVIHWELYNQTGHRLIGERIFRFSDERAGLLRARSIFSSPIVLGYAMVLLLTLIFHLKPQFTKKKIFYGLTGLAAAALLVSFSRGPWVAAVLALATYVFIGSSLAKALGSMILAGIGGTVVLVTTEFGRSILNLIPFFGGTENANTFDYRARLLENGLVLVKRNPLFGDHNFLQTPEMEEMRQGQGIIDTVNVYLTIAMYKGLLGLFLYVMIFFPTMFYIYRRVKAMPAEEHELAQAGRMLISFMVGGLFLIATVSNVDYVPVLTYLGAALMASWVGLYRSYENRASASTALAVHRRGSGFNEINSTDTANI